jgi:ubiquinol-cytochrome c reductase cytochrome b subunit
VLAALVVLASVLPAGLEEEADPLVTPPHIKPEWYFLSAYQLLKVVPRTIGILAPIVAVGILLVLPFLDRNPAVAKRRRPIALSAGLLGVIGIVALTIWGAQS